MSDVSLTTQVKMLMSEMALPLSILYTQLIHRRFYSSAAYESAPHWSIDDLDAVLDSLPLVFSTCSGFKHLAGKILALSSTQWLYLLPVTLIILSLLYPGADNFHS